MNEQLSTEPAQPIWLELRNLPFYEKEAVVDRLDTRKLSPEMLAHIAIELQRSAMLLMQPFVQELRSSSSDENRERIAQLLLEIEESYTGPTKRGDKPPDIDAAHERISRLTRADEQ